MWRQRGPHRPLRRLRGWRGRILHGGAENQRQRGRRILRSETKEKTLRLGAAEGETPAAGRVMPRHHLPNH